MVTLFRADRSRTATELVWLTLVVPFTTSEPPPVAARVVKTAPVALLGPTVKSPLSVSVTPAGMVRTLAVGLAVVLPDVLEMLPTVVAGTLLMSVMLPGGVADGAPAGSGVPRTNPLLDPKELASFCRMVPL